MRIAAHSSCQTNRRRHVIESRPLVKRSNVAHGITPIGGGPHRALGGVGLTSRAVHRYRFWVTLVSPGVPKRRHNGVEVHTSRALSAQPT